MEHKLIEDADRHEPKGATLATVGQVMKSNGDGTTYFGFVNRDEIAGTIVKAGYSKLIYAESSASSQQPSATGTPLQVEFGAAQSTDDVSLGSTGILTFTTSGQYLLELSYRYGRSTSTGSAILFARAMLNSTQLVASSCAVLVDTAQVIPTTNTIIIDANAGDTFKLQILRDSAGLNDGGLKQTTPSLTGWNSSPSANMTVYKYLGDV